MMMKSLSLFCLIAVAEAMKATQCCGGAVTTCCPDSVDKHNQNQSSAEHEKEFQDELEDIENDIQDLIDDAEEDDSTEPTYDNEVAKTITDEIFSEMDGDMDNSITVTEMEANVDRKIAEGHTSNREGDHIRAWFNSADGFDGEHDYEVSYDDLYAYNESIVDSGELEEMIADLHKNKSLAIEMVTEWFTGHLDHKIHVEDWIEIDAGDLIFNDEWTQEEVDWLEDQMDNVLEWKENSDSKGYVTEEQMVTRFMVMLDDKAFNETLLSDYMAE